MTKRERDELAALNKRVADLEAIALEIKTGIRALIWIGQALKWFSLFCGAVYLAIKGNPSELMRVLR